MLASSTVIMVSSSEKALHDRSELIRPMARADVEILCSRFQGLQVGARTCRSANAEVRYSSQLYL